MGTLQPRFAHCAMVSRFISLPFIKCRRTYRCTAVDNSFARRATKSLLWWQDILQTCSTGVLCLQTFEHIRERSAAFLGVGELLRKFCDHVEVGLVVHRDSWVIKVEKKSRSKVRFKSARSEDSEELRLDSED